MRGFRRRNEREREPRLRRAPGLVEEPAPRGVGDLGGGLAGRERPQGSDPQRRLVRIGKWPRQGRVVDPVDLGAPYSFGHLLVRRWRERDHPDRKSTRLNSSHVAISYAVFCLKKNTYS